MSGSAHCTPLCTLSSVKLSEVKVACGMHWVPTITPFFELAGRNHCTYLLNSLLTCFLTSRSSLSALIYPIFCYCCSSNFVQMKHLKPSISLLSFTYLVRQIFFLPAISTFYKTRSYICQKLSTFFMQPSWHFGVLVPYVLPGQLVAVLRWLVDKRNSPYPQYNSSSPQKHVFFLYFQWQLRALQFT